MYVVSIFYFYYYISDNVMFAECFATQVLQLLVYHLFIIVCDLVVGCRCLASSIQC